MLLSKVITIKERIVGCVRALVPHPYTVRPNNAVDCALRWLDSGGRLFLLSILDDGDLKNLQYRTGWSSESVAIRSLKESYEKLQKGYSEKYVKLVNKKSGAKQSENHSFMCFRKPCK